jgi:cytochrome c-type biogenesis protein CcmH
VSAVPYIGFALVALLALAFAVVPLARMKAVRGKPLLLAAIAVFVLGIGGGTYWMVGRPGLATRSTDITKTRDVNALVPMLIERVRKDPNDSKAWRFLGQAYMSSDDGADAAKAFAEVIRIEGKGHAEIDAAYGAALAMQAGGRITPEADTAFQAALAADPKNTAARFYLGLSHAQRDDAQGATAYWQSLLADTPDGSPLHQMLVDRLAQMTSQTAGPGGMPDPRQMVARLAARLKADPKDGPGWVRLMRAYHVLGDDAKAREALATARKTFAGDKDMLAAFDTAEKDLK